MRNIVNGILLSGDQLLLVYRSPQRSFYPDCWSFPGGHVEQGESNEAALKRELQEEIGIVPTQFNFIDTISTDPPSKDSEAAMAAKFHFYAVTQWSGQPNLLGDVHTQLLWASLAEAKVLENLALRDYSDLFSKLSASR